MKSNSKMARIIKPILFILILGMLILFVQGKAFKISDVRSYQTFKGFYAEDRDSLDMVYIGQSNVYPFWSGPLAWEDYGITSYPLAIGALPARSVKYMVEEGLKTQSKAIYLINLNSFTDIYFDVSHLHNVVDYMKMSGTKVRMINDLYPYLKDQECSRMEFFFPIIRFHPGWNEVTESSFEFGYNGLKGGSIYTNYLETIEDVSSIYRPTDARVELSEEQQEVFSDLLDYLDANDVKVLFVTVPQAIQDESVVGQLNTAKDLAASRGYDVLDMEGKLGEIGLDTKTDFYNNQHLNVHGSIKFTDYLAKFLVEKYGLKDKRNEDGYTDWEDAASGYHDIIDGYALDMEYPSESRDYSLQAPKILHLVETGQSFYLGWERVDGASGYSVYRKYIGNDFTNSVDPASKWEKVVEVKSDVDYYVDEGLELFGIYSYRVVPFRESAGGVNSGRVYGLFDYVGKQGITRIDPPKILDFETTQEGNTITWEPIEGVEGYAVVRRIDGQTFVNIAQVSEDVTSYTDAFYQKDVSYTYSVAGYIKVGDSVEDWRYGYYDQNGPRYEGGER